jgi:DNA ligase-1
LAEKTVIAALARAVVLGSSSKKSKNITSKTTEQLQEAHRILNQAYIEVPNHEIVINNLLTYGIDELMNHCYLQPG